MLDPRKIKSHFPILSRQIKGKTLVYLDNASTTQKPKSVIQAITDYYENTNANIHRGIHALSEEATEAYEKVRLQTAKFINAQSEREIVFTRNSTEAINLVAFTWGEANIREGDEIIVSAVEHHSNLVPWQELCKRKKAKLLVIPLKADYTLDMEVFKQLLSAKTKLVAVSAMSNVLGLVPNFAEIITDAHKFNAKVLLDGAQFVAHRPTDVQKIDCDFLVFSSHKMLGPTGLGILYAKEEILTEMPPFLFGGDMVKVVDQKGASWNDLPWKYEAGTPNIADTIAFGKALEFLEEVGMENITKHDTKLLQYAIEKLSKYSQVNLHTPRNIEEAGAVLSFTIEDVHPHDIASIFNEEAVAIRSGHHCAQPLMERLGIPATTRMSFYLYNSEEDIDRAEIALQNVLKIFKI